MQDNEMQNDEMSFPRHSNGIDFSAPGMGHLIGLITYRKDVGIFVYTSHEGIAFVGKSPRIVKWIKGNEG